VKRENLINIQNTKETAEPVPVILQTTETNKSLTQTKDSLRTSEIVKNKASPDKGSQALSIIIPIIILIILILIIIVVRKI